MANKKTAAGGIDTSIEGLAKALMAEWDKNGEAADRRVGAEDVVSGLKSLLNSGILPAKVLSITGDPRIMLARFAIEKFQNLAGVKEDGVIGRITRGKLFKFKDCDQSNKSTENIPKGDAAPGKPSSGLLYYHLEPKLMTKQISGRTCRDMIADAITKWTLKVDLVVRRTDDASEANILMKFDNIDGKGNTLGIAHIGGKGVTQQLTLRFDENEDWDQRSFLNTACHEFGHILGLKHSHGPGQIMSPFQDLSIEFPTDEDIARMQDEWGVSRRLL